MPNYTLKDLADRRDISLRELAHRAEVREGTLYDIVNNKIERLPSKAIDSICEVLDCEPGDWIKRKKIEDRA